jgi:hypothetical protein
VGCQIQRWMLCISLFGKPGQHFPFKLYFASTPRCIGFKGLGVILIMLLEAQAFKLKAELYSRGFVVVPGLVDPEICAAAATAVRGRATRMLKMMGMPSKGHFKALLDGDWIHSPDGWNGPPFGPICARGWQQGPGTGRIGPPPRD